MELLMTLAANYKLNTGLHNLKFMAKFNQGPELLCDFTNLTSIMVCEKVAMRRNATVRFDRRRQSTAASNFMSLAQSLALQEHKTDSQRRLYCPFQICFARNANLPFCSCQKLTLDIPNARSDQLRDMLRIYSAMG